MKKIPRHAKIIQTKQRSQFSFLALRHEDDHTCEYCCQFKKKKFRFIHFEPGRCFAMPNYRREAVHHLPLPSSSDLYVHRQSTNQTTYTTKFMINDFSSSSGGFKVSQKEASCVKCSHALPNIVHQDSLADSSLPADCYPVALLY